MTILEQKIIDELKEYHKGKSNAITHDGLAKRKTIRKT